MAEDKYYINCTYKDKDEAKLLEHVGTLMYVNGTYQWVLIEVSSENGHLNQALALF